jgi:hypothetical protein
MRIRVGSTYQLLLTGFLFCSPATPQSTSGTILGSVEDPSGALIAGARVTATCAATGVTSRAASNSDGLFVVPDLAPCQYRIEVRQSGFQTLLQTGFDLHVDQQLRLRLTLPLDVVRETIQVNGNASPLQTESAATGEVIDSDQILNLPLLGRNFSI